MDYIQGRSYAKIMRTRRVKYPRQNSKKSPDSLTPLTPLGPILFQTKYFHFINIQFPQVLEILPHGQGNVYPALSKTMSADDLATQGARASAAMVLAY